MRSRDEEKLSKTGKVVWALMKEKGLRTGEVAAMMGKPVKVVSDRIGQTNISVKALDEIVRVLGYKIMVVPYGTKGDNFHDVG